VCKFSFSFLQTQFHEQSPNGGIFNTYTSNVDTYTANAETYNGSVATYNGSVTTYTGNVATCSGNANTYNGIVSTYNGIVNAYNGIVNAYNGTAGSWNHFFSLTRETVRVLPQPGCFRADMQNSYFKPVVRLSILIPAVYRNIFGLQFTDGVNKGAGQAGIGD
ncbi:MAG: hypothetical protein WCR72_12875, partial [Bacteroidota bacterium]